MYENAFEKLPPEEQQRIEEEADLLLRSRLYNAEQAGKRHALKELATKAIENGRTLQEISEFMCVPVAEIEEALQYQDR